MSTPVRVHYYRVHDLDYPRNRRIRAVLDSHPDITVTVATPSTRRNRIARQLEDVWRLIRSARNADVLVLSEMRLKHATVVGLAGRLTGARVIVDGFIGLTETLLDWSPSRAGSLRWRLMRTLDALAVRVSDLYLTDTRVRAAAIASAVPTAQVRSLAVGAPAWAVYQRPIEHERLELLYYGNYIPLHGLDLVVDALHLLTGRRDVRLTLIGDGGCRAGIESRIRAEGLAEFCRFLPAIAETELAEAIASADIVLGVFGDSAKARSVIANKVWQGLACGRTTITQDSPAFAEIRDAAGDLLVTTTPGSAAALADAIDAWLPTVSAEEASTLAARLQLGVDGDFAVFVDDLRKLARR